MKAFIANLLLLVLLGIRIPASFAQSDQSYQKLAQEMEALKEHILTLQSQLQTVENVEKIELTAKLADAQAKLADANAKLMDAEFGKFERDLRDSNDGWLWRWTGFFGVIIAVILAVIGASLWFSLKLLIADRVEKSLDGFKEAVNQLDEIKDQLKVLQAGHAVSVLEHFIRHHLGEESHYRQQTAFIPEEALLQVFDDEYTVLRNLDFRQQLL